MCNDFDVEFHVQKSLQTYLFKFRLCLFKSWWNWSKSLLYFSNRKLIVWFQNISLIPKKSLIPKYFSDSKIFLLIPKHFPDSKIFLWFQKYFYLFKNISMKHSALRSLMLLLALSFHGVFEVIIITIITIIITGRSSSKSTKSASSSSTWMWAGPGSWTPAEQ